MRRFLLYATIGLVGLFAVVQLVPYRVTNPSVDHEPTWDSPETRRLAAAACFDCHSNDTATYWWEDVAPLSWWITNHVAEGRNALNFSECKKRTGGESGDAAETVTGGSMPPDYYTWLGLHSGAALTSQERAALASGLRKTLKGWDCGNGDN
jgi:mono/diheme cytochrome c family protein